MGGRVDFKIDTNVSAYSIRIYRIGYYNGDGARKITDVTPSASLPQHQPACITDVCDRALRLRQLGRVRVVEHPEHCGVGCVHRPC